MLNVLALATDTPQPENFMDRMRTLGESFRNLFTEELGCEPWGGDIFVCQDDFKPDPLDIDPTTNNQLSNAQHWVPPARRDPLTFDLDGDGLETVGIDPNNPILFDHDADGIRTASGWISPDDAFLVLDRDGNGTIDDGTELFGNSTPLDAGGTAIDGFEALGQEDTNQDGQVNDQDANFTNLRLWRDLNQDGISQSSELFTLAELNIAGINVAKTENNQLLPNGNALADSGTFVYTDGTTGGMGTTGALGDVDLREDTFYSHFTNPVPLTPEAQSLPNMHGSGQVRDLREAASLSTDLTATLSGYSQATTRAAQLSQLDALVKAWSDTSPMLTTATGAYAGHPLSISFEGVSAGSAEYNAWLDKLTIIERFNGRTFRQIPAGTASVSIGFSRAQMDFLNQSYAAIKLSVYDGLMLQTRVKPWLDSISITLDVREFRGHHT